MRTLILDTRAAYWNNHRAVAVLAAVLGLTGCKSLGYSFQLSPRSQGTVLITERQLFDRTSRLAKAAGAAYGKFLAPEFHAATEPALARRDRRTTDITFSDAVCARLRPLASFVHLSDAQIKEASVEMEPPITHLISGANRHDSLELFGYGTFLSTVLSINTLASGSPVSYAPCPDPLPPQFTIHTGDAIDASMFSELFQFLAVVNELETPFLNVIGNHDDLFFGTLPPDKVSGFNVVAPFVPVADYKRFMRGHHPDASRIDMSIPASPREVHEPTAFPPRSTTTSDFPGSFVNGFDWRCDELTDQGQTVTTIDSFPLCEEAEGYYAKAFHVKSPDTDATPLEVHLIILNTFEWGPGSVWEGAVEQRSRGRMRDSQFTWLGDQLAQEAAARSVTLVFGHHPFADFVDDGGNRLKQILRKNDQVIGYFTGHTHTHEVRCHRRDDGTKCEVSEENPLWEVIGGANISYPQFGVQVELLEDTSDESTGYIRLRSFEERLSLAPASCDATNQVGWPLPCIAEASREGAKLSAGDDWEAMRASAIAQANGMLIVRLER